MSEDLKPVSQDTPAQAAAETVETQGPVDTNTADTTEVETEPQVEMVPKSEFEQLVKEREQAEKRKNQLEKLLEKAEKDPESLKKDETIAELQTQLQQFREEQEKETYEKQVAEYTKEMDSLFEKQLESYPEAVKKAARFNRDKFGVLNIVGDAQYGYQAEKNIKVFLEELSSQLGDVKPEITVDATNPAIVPNATEEQLIQNELSKPVQQRDWSKIIGLRIGKK